MSGTVLIYRAAGPTVCLSVVATSHAAVPVNVTVSDTASYVALVNPGAIAVAVKLSVAGTVAVLPVDGTPGDFILPALMQSPIVVPLPSPKGASPCQITAIGTGAGPTLIYATPLVMQG